MAPGLAGVAFANRLHLFSVEGALPEVLDWNRRVSAYADRKVVNNSRGLLLLLLMRVVTVVVKVNPQECFKLHTRGDLCVGVFG